MTTQTIEVRTVVGGASGIVSLIDAVTVVGSATHVSVDDVEVDLAKEIQLTMSNGASTNMEIRVYTTPTKDGTFDTVPYTSFKLGANERVTRPLVPGFAKMKVSAVNGDAVNDSDVTVIVKPTWV